MSSPPTQTPDCELVDESTSSDTPTIVDALAVPTTSTSSSPSPATTYHSPPSYMSSPPTQTPDCELVDESTSSDTPTIVDALAVPTISPSSSPSLATAHHSPPNEVSPSPTHTSEQSVRRA